MPRASVGGTRRESAGGSFAGRVGYPVTRALLRAALRPLRARDGGGDAPSCNRPAMPEITAITAHPRRPGRFVVSVDGAPHVTLSVGALADLGLHVGLALSSALAARVEQSAGAQTAYDHALALLAARARSERELRQRLARKGDAPEAIDEAVGRLRADGLLDEAEFARQFARVRLTGQGASRRRVQQELARRGVERGIADAAIAAILDEEGTDQTELIEAVARKKARTLAGVDRLSRRRRLYAFLARRGYAPDEIREAMVAVLGERASAEDDTAGGDGG